MKLCVAVVARHFQILSCKRSLLSHDQRNISSPRYVIFSSVYSRQAFLVALVRIRPCRSH